MRRLGRSHRAGEVDLDDLPEHLGPVLVTAPDDAGRVDQYVEPVERSDQVFQGTRLAEVQFVQPGRLPELG